MDERIERLKRLGFRFVEHVDPADGLVTVTVRQGRRLVDIASSMYREIAWSNAVNFVEARRYG